MLVMWFIIFLLVYSLVFIRSNGSLGFVKVFECGMDRVLSKGLYISLRFFMLSLLFLLMDLELVLVIFSPIVIPGSVLNIVKFSLIMWVFVLGTVWEWWIGSIDWSL